MKQTFLINSMIPKSQDSEIYIADNGRGYTKDGIVHLLDGNVHFLYEDNYWYMQNDKTGKIFSLGEGASPTITLENIKVIDKKYWDEITYIPQEDSNEQL